MIDKMSRMRYPSAVLLFSILAAWVIRNISLVAAFPQTPQSEDGDGGGIILQINGLPEGVPPLEYNEHMEGPLVNVMTISSARLINAPPGYGCVFASRRPNYGDGEGNNAENFPFVSTPIYGPASASYGSPEFSRIDLDAPFLNAESLLCYRLPNPADVGPSRGGPGVDRADFEMLIIATDTERRGTGEQSDVGLKLMPALGDANFPPGASISSMSFTGNVVLHRAAVVYAPKSIGYCSVESHLNYMNVNRFWVGAPLASTVLRAKNLRCYVFG